MAAPAQGGAHAGRVHAQPTGSIAGTAHSSACRTLSNYTVQVRSLQTGQLAGTSASNAAGSFSFPGLLPGNYVVEIVDQAGAIVGGSSSIAVAAGAITTVTVSAGADKTIACASGSAAGTGISTAVLVTTAAVAAGIAGVVLLVKSSASPSR